MNSKPLGRNPNQISPVIEREQKAFAAMKLDMRALPPANSPENAAKHRACLIKHASPKLAEFARNLFAANGLKFE